MFLFSSSSLHLIKKTFKTNHLSKLYHKDLFDQYQDLIPLHCSDMIIYCKAVTFGLIKTISSLLGFINV